MRKYRKQILDMWVKNIRKIKFQDRFIGIILVATVLPLAMSTIILFYQFTRSFQESNFENIQKELELYSVLIDTKLEEYERIANEIAASVDTIRIVSCDYEEAKLQDYIELSKYNNRLENWSSNLKELLTIEIVNDTGIIAYKPYCFIDENTEDSFLYQKVKENSHRKVFLGACKPENRQKALMFPDIKDYQNPILFSTKIKTPYRNHYIGSVNMYIKEGLLTDLLDKAVSYETASDTFFRLENIYIVDQENTIVMHKERSQIGKQLSPSMVQALKVNSGSDYLGKKPVENPKGKNEFVFASKSRISGFYVVSTVDSKLFFQDIQEIKIKNFVVSLLIILIAVGISYIHSISIKQPLECLVQGMKQLENNDFQIRIKDQGKDEMHFVMERFNQMVGEIRNLMEQSIEIEKERAEMELRILEEQINPHFLYNILDMINWMAFEQGQEEICRSVNALSKFYRLGLNSGRRNHTIALELEHVKAYTDIQNIRLKGRIKFRFQIEQDILRYTTVKMILQPLVENAIEHGIIPRGGTGNIEIKGKQEGEKILFSVEDDGIGIDGKSIKELLSPKSKGYGLYNVDSRVKLAFGEGYGVELYPREMAGTVALIWIGVRMEEDEYENITYR